MPAGSPSLWGEDCDDAGGLRHAVEGDPVGSIC